MQDAVLLTCITCTVGVVKDIVLVTLAFIFNRVLNTN